MDKNTPVKKAKVKAYFYIYKGKSFVKRYKINKTVYRIQ